ncbi:MAG: nitroreductase family deazaflavin-dependent oxidoreductase [Acidimicrobiales bacterium]
MPFKDRYFKAFTEVHRGLFVVSKGRVGGKVVGMPVVMLTTTGRRSGKKRHSMLTTPLELGDSFVLVASFGGDDRHPAWFLNLRDHLQVDATIGARTRAMVARVATGDERVDLWSRLTAAHPNYGGYQTKTNREIPVVVLDPVTEDR